MLRAESRWGSSFVATLSEDLREAIPNAKGFSKTNLFYMIGFYRLYHMGEKGMLIKNSPKLGEN